MEKRFNSRGQVTIFIIIALIVVVAVFAFFVFPEIAVTTSTVNPSSFLRECIEDNLNEAKGILSRQGGYLETDNSVLYEGESIQYLCYTSEDYVPCKIQQPLLVDHIESEIESYINPRARECLQQLESEYESRGFDVQSQEGETEVEISLGKISVDFLTSMTVTREDSTQSFEKFAVGLESRWYDLILISVDILEFEAVLGDSETTAYTQFYPDLIIEKVKRDGDTIYKLRNVVTEDEFVFATRSLVWPQGYGGEQ